MASYIRTCHQTSDLLTSVQKILLFSGDEISRAPIRVGRTPIAILNDGVTSVLLIVLLIIRCKVFSHLVINVEN